MFCSTKVPWFTACFNIEKLTFASADLLSTILSTDICECMHVCVDYGLNMYIKHLPKRTWRPNALSNYQALKYVIVCVYISLLVNIDLCMPR